MNPIGPRPQRSRARGQGGFTLIEVLVSVAILTILGGVFAGVFGVGYKTLGPQGSGARLSASADLMVFEQLLSRDVAQASCVYIPHSASAPSGPYGPYGSCSNLFASAHAQATCNNWSWNGQASVAVLCLAWPQLSSNSCQVAVYGVVTNGQITGQVRRQEYSIAAGDPTYLDPTGGQAVTGSSDAQVSVSVSAPATTGGWITSLPVTVTTSALSNPPTGSFILRPVAEDPAALTSATGYPQC